MPNYIEKSRHGLYYLRLPSRLAHLNAGKRISLKTHSKRLAIQRASTYLRQVEQLMSPLMSLNRNEREEFAFEQASNALVADLAAQNEQLDCILKSHPNASGSDAISMVIQARLRNVMVRQANDLIAEQIRGGYLAPGLTLNDQQQIFQNLFQYAENVAIEFLGGRASDGAISPLALAKIEKEYRQTLYSSYLEMCDSARTLTVLAHNAPNGDMRTKPPGEDEERQTNTIFDIYELWIAEHKSLGGSPTFSTEQEYQRHANVLTILSDERSVEEFSKEDFSELHKKTLKIKAYSATGKNKSNLTKDILMPPNEEYKPIAADTAVGYSQRLHTLHLYAFHKGLTSVDPASVSKPMFGRITGTAKRGLSHDDTPKKSYKIPELQSIFDGWIYRPTKIHRNIRIFHYQFWMPLIAIFTGMRIAEISGLTPRDIARREGIWCIKIEENDSIGRRIKTLSSKRIVPIHSKLKELGFIEYVQMRKAAKSMMLFDGLTYDNKNGWGHAASTFFNRIPSKESKGSGYFYKSGVHIKALDGRDMHGFRHTLIDELRNSGLAHSLVPYIVESISGHEKNEKTEADRYGDGLRLDQRAEFLEYATYSGLDLSHVSYETFISGYEKQIEKSLEKWIEKRTKDIPATMPQIETTV